MDYKDLDAVKEVIRYKPDDYTTSFGYIDPDDARWITLANEELDRATTLIEIVAWLKKNGWVLTDALNVFVPDPVIEAFYHNGMEGWDT